jgi:hypothetical protein
MRLIIFTLLLIFHTMVHAENRAWEDDERVWAVAATVFSLTDWATSRNMTKRYNEGYYEQNPLLGQHPTTAQMDRYFAIGIPLMLLIADNLDEYRKPWLIGITAIEAAVSANNLRIGLRIQF